MEYPINGRVVVVDDEIEEEAVPLIKALSRRGIAVRFFTGRESELPDTPLGSVRLLFLDLKLEGIDFTQDPIDVARALRPVVERIIGPENGPYILFGWTKHPTYMNALVQELDIKPVLCLDMEKSDCKEGVDLDFDKIIAKFDEKIADIGHFKTIFDWENLVNNSAADTVNNVFPKDSDKAKIESILFCIAKANLGEQISISSKEQRIKAGLQCFGDLLTDTIDNNLHKVNFSSSPDLAPPAAEIDPQVRCKINSKLLLRKASSDAPRPGNVYLEFDNERKKTLKAFMDKRLNWDKHKDRLKKEVQPQDVPPADKERIVAERLCQLQNQIIREEMMGFVEVTPLCDYTQNLHKYYRIIPCFFLEEALYTEFGRHKEEAESYYLTPTLFLERFNKSFRVVLDYRGFFTLGLSDLGGKEPLFRLSNELLFDIQHKAGAHFGRAGIISLLSARNK